MKRLDLSPQVLARAFADIVLLNGALALTCALEVLFSPRPSLAHWHVWWLSGGVVTVLTPLSFYALGLYTRGRNYMSSAKALRVLQAATVVFGILGLILYFFRLQASFPRSALIIEWAIGSVMVLGARLWTSLWRAITLESLGKHGSSESRPLVLLIGGAGYVGSAVVPKLLARGCRVRILDCLLFGKDAIAQYLNHPDLELVRGDFRNVDTVVAAMKDVTSVVHLGGLVGDPACAVDEELTIQVNLIATRMIAQVAKGAGVVRFVFASSCSVYGASDQILDERSVLNPVSLYARSKIASEKILLEMKSSEFEPVLLRFGTVYGLSGRTRFDLVVNLLAAKAVVEGIITVFGKDQWRPFLHVDDAAASVVAAVTAPGDAVSPVIFNVGSDEQNKTLGQVGTLIASMVPGAVVKNIEDNVDRRNYRVDFSRIRHHLGFRPVWTLQAGIQQVLDAIFSGAVRDYLDPKYSNVKVMNAPVRSRDLPVMGNWAQDLINSPQLSNVDTEVATQSRATAGGR